MYTKPRRQAWQSLHAGMVRPEDDSSPKREGVMGIWHNRDSKDLCCQVIALLLQ